MWPLREVGFITIVNEIQSENHVISYFYCLPVPVLRRLGFLTSLYLLQKGEVGAGIFNSVELLRIGSRKMFVLSFSVFPYAEG